MKKLLLVVLVALLGFSVNAQTFGVRLGYNMSGLRIDENFSDYLDVMGIEGKLTDGVNIGLVVEKPIKEKLTLHAELNFAQKGSAYDMYVTETNQGTIGHGQTNLNYLEIPIMAKFSFGPAYVAIGPHIGFLLSAQEINYKDNPTVTSALIAGMIDWDQDGNPGPAVDEATAETILLGMLQAAGQNITSLRDDEFYDMDKDQMNGIDFGSQLTIGAQFPVSTFTVFTEARATVAFTNWEDSDWFKDSGFDYKKNLAFSFSVGILFGQKGE